MNHERRIRLLCMLCRVPNKTLNNFIHSLKPKLNISSRAGPFFPMLSEK